MSRIVRNRKLDAWGRRGDFYCAIVGPFKFTALRTKYFPPLFSERVGITHWLYIVGWKFRVTYRGGYEL